MINQARLEAFRVVRDILREDAMGDLTAFAEVNDALEPVLEVAIIEGAYKVAWIFGMMDEPVWGYDLEVDDGEDRSWSFVKSASLDLPEASEPRLVAQRIREVVAADRLELAPAEVEA